MNCDNASLLLYAVTDRSWLHGQTLYEQAEQALQGGATFLQLREKELDEAHFQEEAIALKALCRQYGVPFVLDDNVALAVATDADGVHVGQSDMAAGKVRALIGPDKILGVSAQTVEEALLAEREGADYLGVGAVFPTGTKADANAVSYDTLREICAAVSIPVIAIGVPTVVDYPRENDPEPMMVTPREIDTVIENAARTIAMAVNCALQPELSLEDLMALTQ